MRTHKHRAGKEITHRNRVALSPVPRVHLTIFHIQRLFESQFIFNLEYFVMLRPYKTGHTIRIMEEISHSYRLVIKKQNK